MRLLIALFALLGGLSLADIACAHGAMAQDEAGLVTRIATPATAERTHGARHEQRQQPPVGTRAWHAIAPNPVAAAMRPWVATRHPRGMRALE